MNNEQAIKLLRKETSPMEIHILEIEGLDYDEVTDKILLYKFIFKLHILL